MRRDRQHKQCNVMVWAKTEKGKQFGHNVVNKVLVRFWHRFPRDYHHFRSGKVVWTTTKFGNTL